MRQYPRLAWASRPTRGRIVAIWARIHRQRGRAAALLSVQNRLIKYLGYDNVVYLEDAPEYAGATAAEAVPAGS